MIVKLYDFGAQEPQLLSGRIFDDGRKIRLYHEQRGTLMKKKSPP